MHNDTHLVERDLLDALIINTVPSSLLYSLKYLMMSCLVCRLLPLNLVSNLKCLVGMDSFGSQVESEAMASSKATKADERFMIVC
jgi:hypothetical protein